MLRAACRRSDRALQGVIRTVPSISEAAAMLHGGWGGGGGGGGLEDRRGGGGGLLANAD